MTKIKLECFGRTFEKTNLWLLDLMQELGWAEEERVYHALRAVLHALRDRLTVKEVADLGAQLPMLVRGVYYDGWSPMRETASERTKEQFLAEIADPFQGDIDVDAEEVARAVFTVLSKHVSGGEIEDVQRDLPGQICALWQQPEAPGWLP